MRLNAASSRSGRAFNALALAITLLVQTGCDRDAAASRSLPDPHSIGDAGRGRDLVSSYGCGSCHTIAGIPGANGMVGPSLSGFGQRIYIAGHLRNTPDNLVRWIRDPQSISPGNVMPRMGIDRRDAADIAAFLYTRRDNDS